MKLKTYIFIAANIFSTKALAAQVEIPNTFAAGTKAVAAEVNENFSVIANESNAQNLRISALESASITNVSDQLICVVHYTWPTAGTSYDCVQSSDPSNVRSLTFTQVVQEGWIAVSVGGDSNNRVTYIFSK